MRKVVKTDKAPAALGPYVQANIVDNLVFASGQLGMIPETGDLVEGGIKEQTEQACKNIENLMEASGTSIKNVVKATCFMKDMNDFAAMNEVYAAHFGTGAAPARSAVQVDKLPKDALVEIEVIAVIE